MAASPRDPLVDSSLDRKFAAVRGGERGFCSRGGCVQSAVHKEHESSFQQQTTGWLATERMGFRRLPEGRGGCAFSLIDTWVRKAWVHLSVKCVRCGRRACPHFLIEKLAPRPSWARRAFFGIGASGATSADPRLVISMHARQAP